MTKAGTKQAQGRLNGLEPVAVIDIGSNSVRLVVYEGLVRSPTVLFNEKILCGLGQGVSRSGLLDPGAVEMALRTLARFRGLCRQLQARHIHVLATAAAREARNGDGFIARVQEIIGVPVQLLSGEQEAHYSACGVLSAFYHPCGIVGDLGGGSLELIPLEPQDVAEETVFGMEQSLSRAVSLSLGGLRLRDMAQGSMTRAKKIVQHHLRQSCLAGVAVGKNFYAVGGTWRNLAKLHMAQKSYPLAVMHHYQPDLKKLKDFLCHIAKGSLEKLRGIDMISRNRRQLLPYGALVLSELIRYLRPERVVFSGAGMREGYLYASLPAPVRSLDPLLSAAEAMSILRARSPEHAHELIEWSAQAFSVLGLEENHEERRLREAVCYLSDIAWRINPDYRGSDAADQVAFGDYNGIDHKGRVFAALTLFFRNQGLVEDAQAPLLIQLVDAYDVRRARILAAIMRISNLFCASSPGVLPQLIWRRLEKIPKNGKLSLDRNCTRKMACAQEIVLEVPKIYSELIAERPLGRLQHLAKLVCLPVRFTLVD